MMTFSQRASHTKPTKSDITPRTVDRHLFVLLTRGGVSEWCRKTVLGEMHVHAYLSYDACLILNMLACHALHLCVTLGKKARLHLIFSYWPTLNPSIPIRCFFLKEHLTPIGIKQYSFSLSLHLLLECKYFFSTAFSNPTDQVQCRHHCKGTCVTAVVLVCLSIICKTLG